MVSMNSRRSGLASAKACNSASLMAPKRGRTARSHVGTRTAAMSDEESQAFAEAKPLRREFMLTMGRKGFPDAEMQAALARLRRTYERMDAEIARSGGPWLLGKEITLADISVMPALVRMADLGRAGDWQDLPRVVRWFDEIRAQPAFALTYYPGSLLSERMLHLRQSSAAHA